MDSIPNEARTALASHPLAPLTKEEIEEAAALVRDALAKEGALRFEVIELMEPDKAAVRAYKPGQAFERRARLNVYPCSGIGVWRCQVSLSDRTVISIEHRPEACPMIQLEEFEEIERAVKADPAFVAACAKRGVTDMDLVCVDPWSGGAFGRDDEAGRHISHTFAWVRTRADDNLYAHPLEGLNALVDVKTGEVIRVDDHGGAPVPRGESNYAATFQGETRDDLKPIDVVQPEGVSFKLAGHRLTWHDWSLAIGFNAREGLTLHDVRIKERPLVYRASMSEMVVPYGSPEAAHYRKNVFDIGEYGLGKLANSLELGCDCLGSIQYLDVWLNDMQGQAYAIKNAICIHEEDDGILWKHWDFRTEKTEIRRARRLVVSSISTVGNYEYGSYWYFYLDGTMEFEMKATGIINTVACEPGQPSKYAVEVAPGVAGQIHQHLFCARLDMAVDGDANSVVECNTKMVPMGPDNPHGNAFYQEETLLARESLAARRAEPASQRYWKFLSAEGRNALGKPTAYKLEPSHTVTPFLSPEGPSGRRSNFIYNHLWVTAFDPEERYAAGEYVNHSDGSDGVAAYSAKDRDLSDKDLVAWHVFGLHHMPRTEDFPVQSCISSGFKLMPSGFFDRAITLDLPPSDNKASRLAEACCPAE
ncbi:MAG: primary-amine oxidase [Rhodospirillales bacterium]